MVGRPWEAHPESGPTEKWQQTDDTHAQMNPRSDSTHVGPIGENGSAGAGCEVGDAVSKGKGHASSIWDVARFLLWQVA